MSGLIDWAVGCTRYLINFGIHCQAYMLCPNMCEANKTASSPHWPRLVAHVLCNIARPLTSYMLRAGCATRIAQTSCSFAPEANSPRLVSSGELWIIVEHQFDLSARLQGVVYFTRPHSQASLVNNSGRQRRKTSSISSG